MKTNTFLLPLIAIIMLTSCGSRKNIVYFQDEPLQESVLMSAPKELIYKPDDILTINVTALDPETVAPFNLTMVSGGDATNPLGGGGRRQQTYLVDYDGNIEFPVLGTLKIEGLTRTELTDLLTKRISEYVTNPIVNVRLANFTVTILGEVQKRGTFTIPDERITILEALGMAGDLTIFGRRKNILLIREVDGKKKYSKIDLTTVNVVNSPVYYLQQNDVIYVEPNNARIRASSYNQNNSVLISAIGTLTTIITVFILNNN